MSELSKALGNVAPPHQITHDGKAYSFYLLDQTRKNALEKRLYQNAREAVYIDREHMSSDEYLKRLDAVREAYELGEYGFFGERGSKVIQTARGLILLLETITGESEDAVLSLLTARPEEVNTLLKTVMSESFKGVKPTGSANG
jgi:hypothetical protein